MKVKTQDVLENTQGRYSLFARKVYLSLDTYILNHTLNCEAQEI